MSSVTDSSIIKVEDIIKLLSNVYTDADYNELLNYSKFEQDPKVGDAATD